MHTKVVLLLDVLPVRQFYIQGLHENLPHLNTRSLLLPLQSNMTAAPDRTPFCPAMSLRRGSLNIPSKTSSSLPPADRNVYYVCRQNSRKQKSKARLLTSGTNTIPKHKNKRGRKLHDFSPSTIRPQSISLGIRYCITNFTTFWILNHIFEPASLLASRSTLDRFADFHLIQYSANSQLCFEQIRKV